MRNLGGSARRRLGAMAVLLGFALAVSGVTVAAGTRPVGAATSAPSIKKLIPPFAPLAGGTTVTIKGTNLAGATSVLFGSTPAQIVSSSSARAIQVIAPVGTAGSVNVTVTTPNGTAVTTRDARFTYLGVPRIIEIRPTSGSTAGGTTVAIFGRNLTAATIVKFGSTPGTHLTVLTSRSILVDAPPHAPGTVHLRVASPGGTSSKISVDRFTYVAAPAPEVTSASPSFGSTAGGTSVVISGSGLSGATRVAFGDLDATTYTVDSDNQITATAPAGAQGTVDITVTTYSGTSVVSSDDAFTYIAPVQPSIDSISPTAGVTFGGTIVTITGGGFTDATGVSFGTTPATSFSVDSDTEITATAPPAGAGTVDITVTNALGTSTTSSSDAFTYELPPAPEITSISPPIGSNAGGDAVIITGTGFTGVTDVSFGGTSANFVIDSDTQVTATSPAGTDGVVDIVLSGPGGISTTSSSDEFTYVTPVTPVVDSISPTSGSTTGGTTVTITGSGFAGTTDVSFASTAAASFTVDSDTQITATAPSGSEGVVDITVSNSAGTSTISSADEFTYVVIHQLGITSISPTSGATAGGTVVTITGWAFTDTTEVSFGSNAATSFTVDSDTQITATSPAGAAGTVDIYVTTAAAMTDASSVDQFTYVDAPAMPPSIDLISPSTGGLAGGTTVTITGSGFTSTTDVSFGGTPATSFTVDSDAQITATAPSATAGVVDITVTTSGGTSPTGSSDEFTYDGTPSATGVSPNAGNRYGGVGIQITGRNLTGATSVTVGGQEVSSLFVESDSSILATIPGYNFPIGLADIVVTTPLGTFTITDGFEFTALHLAWHGISPAHFMAVGDTVSQSWVVYNTSGTTQTGVSIVSSSGSAVTCDWGTAGVISGGQINCTSTFSITQAEIDAGRFEDTISVQSDSMNRVVSSRKSVTYLAPDPNAGTPTITSITPSVKQSWGGFTVTVAGANLSTAWRATIAGRDADAVWSNGDGTMSLSMGGYDFTPGLADVQIWTTGGTATVTDGFEFAPVRIDWYSIDQTYSNVGDVLNVSFILYPTVYTPMHNIVLTSTAAPDDLTCDWAVPGELNRSQAGQVNCSGTHTVTQEDIDAGTITDVVSFQSDSMTNPYLSGGTSRYQAP